jgi:Ribonuclease D
MNDKKIINLINFENPTKNIFSKFGVYNLSKKDEEKILYILNLKEKSSTIKNFTYKKVDLKKLKQLKYLLKIVSNNSEINESLIATTSDLKSFLTNSSNKKSFFKGWRKVIFGNYANKLLENKLSFEKINDQIQVKVK